MLKNLEANHQPSELMKGKGRHGTTPPCACGHPNYDSMTLSYNGPRITVLSQTFVISKKYCVVKNTV